MVSSASNGELAEMRQRALSLPFGNDRVALRREIWKLRKEEIASEERAIKEEKLRIGEERRRRHEESLARMRESRKGRRVDGVVIKTIKRVARKDHECFGCLGECPITKGDDYLEVKVTRNGGLVTVRYCQRCHAAITNKVALWGRLEVHGAGQFRWTKLSKAFRERWRKLIDEIVELKRNGKPQREAIRKFMAENQKYEGVGVHGKSGGGRTSPSPSGSCLEGAVQQKD